MKGNRGFHLLCSIFIAATALGAASAWDNSRGKSTETLISLNWARQLVSQAEALALNARDKGEKDPLGWAIRFMSQSVEPRMMKVTRFTGGLDGLTELTREIDSPRALEYSKVFSTDTGSGFKFHIFLGYRGFFGAKTPLGSDLSRFAFFTVFFILSFFMTGRFFGLSGQFKRGSTRLHLKIRSWVSNVKETITKMGIHIRDLLKEAHHLTEIAVKSRDAVGALRDKLHLNLSSVDAGRKSLREAQQGFMQSETVVLNMINEATRLGAPGSPILKMANELHAQLRTTTEKIRVSEKAVRQIQVEMEPWCADADEAYHTYDDFFESTKKLSSHAKETTQSILDHSKMMKSLRESVDDDSRGGAA